MKMIKCEMCGKDFPSRNNAKYCAECKKEIRNERERKWKKIKKSTRNSAASREMLDRRIRAASEAGMSYGKYTAMKRMGEGVAW